jgi:hypothetical protein
MRWFSSRYTHVPLAVLSLVVLVAVIAGLLAHRLGGPWSSWWPLSRPMPSVVAILAEPEAAPGSQADSEGVAAATVGALLRPRPAPPFALESGPLPSHQAADDVEAELNRLGHVTVRFLKEDTARVFVVTAGGFASAEEAHRAARELGRGRVVDAAGVSEVVLGRYPALAEAVAAARPLRLRGLEVRVSEAVATTALYHIRYGQFARRDDAQAYLEALERRGIRGRIVKVR